MNNSQGIVNASLLLYPSFDREASEDQKALIEKQCMIEKKIRDLQIELQEYQHKKDLWHPYMDRSLSISIEINAIIIERLREEFLITNKLLLKKAEVMSK